MNAGMGDMMHANTKTIFDELCLLQDLIKMQSELKMSFLRNFKTMIDETLLKQLIQYCKERLKF